MALPTITQAAPPAAPARGSPLVTLGYRTGFVLIVSLFLLWALAHNLNDILIRQFQKALDLSRAEAGFIQFVFYLAYFLVALPAGRLARHFGYRAGILTGLTLYAAGALLFYPAAELRAYWAFLAALFIIAAGAATLETTANPLIVHFGDRDRASQRLTLAQAFNGLGAVCAPILGGLFIFSGVEHDRGAWEAMSPAARDAYQAAEAQMVQMPYLLLALLVLCVAIGVAFVRLPTARRSISEGTARPGLSAWRSPLLRTAVATQFFYVGAQVGIWSFFVDFVKEQMPATSERNAAFLLSASLFLFMVGRFAGAWLMTRVTPARLLLGFGIAAAALTGMAALAAGAAAVFALTLTSLFMSIMFPTIFALGIADLGEDSATGASLLVMAIIGGAVFPPLMGLVSHGRGLQLALLLPLLCFGVVMLFARAAVKMAPPH